MKRQEVHVVIGAGIAGCLSAILRRRAGYRVILVERAVPRSPGTFPVCTQTSNIVSENHSGAEYPFDPQSARDCLDGRIENETFFPNLIYGGKDYSRIIASRSMVKDGHDIVGQCRQNMSVIRDHYRHYWVKSPEQAVFGDPSQVCREVSTVEGVNDVAAAFITPQRGMNPVLISALLERELIACGVELRSGCAVSRAAAQESGRFRVEVAQADGVSKTLLADQLSLCSAAHSFGLAKRLNPGVELPQIYLALRQILYVDLPDGCTKDFTCLKLEDAYGGMLSPISSSCAMIYHPPLAHIMNVTLNPETGRFPPEYQAYLSGGHPDEASRAAGTLRKLREFYPELEHSKIIGRYLKVAINTVTDSRIRRNIGVRPVQPGCTLSVLPKWTMCAINAKREVSLAIQHSLARGNLEGDEANALLAANQSARIGEPSPVEWTQEDRFASARLHALNMGVPPALAEPLRSEATRSPAPPRAPARLSSSKARLIRI